MSKPTFNSRENECVTLPDDRVVWLSRACAVVVPIVIKHNDNLYVLMGKRGKGCPDEVGRWVLPCGYLNWDETLVQAALREMFEETGFDFISFNKKKGNRVVLENFTDGQPYYVNSNVNNASTDKQNISHYFGAYIEMGKDDIYLPDLTTVYNDGPDEVDELKWVDVDELWEYDIGFNHHKRIEEYLDYIDKNYTLTDRFVRWFNRLLDSAHETFVDFFR